MTDAQIALYASRIIEEQYDQFPTPRPVQSRGRVESRDSSSPELSKVPSSLLYKYPSQIIDRSSSAVINNKPSKKPSSLPSKNASQIASKPSSVLRTPSISAPSKQPSGLLSKTLSSVISPSSSYRAESVSPSRIDVNSGGRQKSAVSIDNRSTPGIPKQGKERGNEEGRGRGKDGANEIKNSRSQANEKTNKGTKEKAYPQRFSNSSSSKTSLQTPRHHLSVQDVRDRKVLKLVMKCLDTYNSYLELMITC